MVNKTLYLEGTTEGKVEKESIHSLIMMFMKDVSRLE
jgi:hypothetical protein